MRNSIKLAIHPHPHPFLLIPILSPSLLPKPPRSLDSSSNSSITSSSSSQFHLILSSSCPNLLHCHTKAKTSYFFQHFRLDASSSSFSQMPPTESILLALSSCAIVIMVFDHQKKQLQGESFFTSGYDQLRSTLWRIEGVPILILFLIIY